MQQNSERYRFNKAERITSEKETDLLFRQGKRKYFGTLALTWLMLPADTEVLPKILVSAPKKQFKKAIDRNRIKRLIREAYRLNKGELVRLATERKQRIRMAVVYTGRELPRYTMIEKDIRGIIGWMIKETKGSG